MNLQYTPNLKTWIVTNGKDKGILIQAEEAFKAMKKGNREFYAPWPPKNDLNQVQPYETGKHCLKDRIFKKVQFQTQGGIVTQYDTTIDAEPTQAQIDFLNRPIYSVKFFN